MKIFQRKFVKVLLALLLLAACAVLLAPTMLSGYVRGVVEREIGARVDGDVRVASVDLGWGGPQRLQGLQVDGGSERGSVRLDAEITQGLWTLATGSAVDVRLAGNVTSAVDRVGSIGLLKLVRSAPSTTSEQTPPASATPNAKATSLLGGRRVTVELSAIDLKATSNGAPLYAIEGLTGSIGLSESAQATAETAKTLALDATGKLTAKTVVHAPRGVTEGAANLLCDAHLPRAADGSFDVLQLTGKVTVEANNLPLPGSVGDLVVERLQLRGEKDARASKLVVDVAARVDGGAPSTVSIDLATGELFDETGAFKPDLEALRAKVDVRALPLASFSPYMRPIGGVAIDLAKDLGDTAEISLVKGEGKTTEVKFDTRRAKLALRGEFDHDAQSFTNGELAASVSARPELLQAFGLDAQSPLVAVVEGDTLTWRVPAMNMPIHEALRGKLTAKLAAPFVWGGLREGNLAQIPVRVEQCTIAVDRAENAPTARASLALSAKYATDGAVQLSSAGTFDPSTNAIANGTIDATLGLDRVTLERLTNGAIRLGTRDRTTLRVNAPSFSWSSAAGVAGNARVAVDGPLMLAGGAASTTQSMEVRELLADITLPQALPQALSRELPQAGAQPVLGNLALTAKVDGAQARVEQKFARIPRDFSDPASLGLAGLVDVRGMDPAFIARLAPATSDAIGALGDGPIDVRINNATDAGALTAQCELSAALVKAKASVRATKDALAFSKTTVDASVSREMLALARLPETIDIDPGAKVLLDIPTLALSRGPEGWQPSGDLALKASFANLVIRRAPGLAAPLALARVDADATYGMRTERATAKGNLTLGSRGSDGTIDFDLVWKKPVEAKLFAGVEGSLSATKLDVARLEPILGFEQGTLAGAVGGTGSLSVECSERDTARAKVRAEFPKARGTVDLAVEESKSGRIARATADVRTQLAADVVARMAGLGADQSRRVTKPVDVAFVMTECVVPLSRELKPDLAATTLSGTGTLSPLVLELAEKDGTRTSISTSALSIALQSKALADEIVLRVASQRASEKSVEGTLEMNAKVRGAIARTAGAQASPQVDATVFASKFPTSALDAFAGTGGSLARALGDAMDLDLAAVGLSKERGSMKALVSSEFAKIDMPEVAIADGFARISAAKPMTATLTLSQPIREQILAPIHQIFADISAGAPARFTVTNLMWPMDGDKRKLDGAFTLETGDVKLVNSGLLSWILSVAQAGLGGAGAPTGFDAFIEPLRANITKGRLTYRDFALRAGKTAQGTWKNSLVFTGDIDLGATPMRVDAITTGVPLSDAGNWSSEARRLFDSIGTVSPELLKSLIVGVKLSGPLYDAQGRPAKLSTSLALPDLGDVLKRDPSAVIEGIGGIIDAFRKKDKK